MLFLGESRNDSSTYRILTPLSGSRSLRSPSGFSLLYSFAKQHGYHFTSASILSPRKSVDFANYRPINLHRNRHRTLTVVNVLSWTTPTSLFR